MLELNGFEVSVASDGVEGVEKTRAWLPDLILMDIRLPGMNGLEATRFIKDDPELKDIPVVALTAYAQEEDEAEAIDAGCTAFIPKQIETRSFRKKIAMLLSVYSPGYFQ